MIFHADEGPFIHVATYTLMRVAAFSIRPNLPLKHTLRTIVIHSNRRKSLDLFYDTFSSLSWPY